MGNNGNKHFMIRWGHWQNDDDDDDDASTDLDSIWRPNSNQHQMTIKFFIRSIQSIQSIFDRFFCSIQN
ncbi:hypothetical protein DERF_014296 [Dermatophagoides farinae]|uniref:Uncharacterized protein n=1 Tax=Dermatophagoides farinae TaxID=6954 RepID=A0A922KWK4_DERFA|nr:hypothetical protein DERF_014296 [Dermatophagoides farinae]